MRLPDIFGRDRTEPFERSGHTRFTAWLACDRSAILPPLGTTPEFGSIGFARDFYDAAEHPHASVR